MYVKGNEIPPDAVVWGDDNGRPLYVCRSFYEVSVRLYPITSIVAGTDDPALSQGKMRMCSNTRR